MRLDDGRVRLLRGRDWRARATITADPATLAAVLDGRLSRRRGVPRPRPDGARRPRVRAADRRRVRRRRATRSRTRSPRSGGSLGVRRAYLEAGPPDAPPVLLLHGLGGTNASMLPLIAGPGPRPPRPRAGLPGLRRLGAPRGGDTAPSDLATWVQALPGRARRDAGRHRRQLPRRPGSDRDRAAPHPTRSPGLVLLCPSPAFRRMRQFVPLVRLLTPGAVGPPAADAAPRSVVRGDPVVLRRARPAARPVVRLGRRRVSPGHAALRPPPGVLRRAAPDLPGSGVRRGRVLGPAAAAGAPSLFVWGDRDWLVPSSFERHVVRGGPARAVGGPAGLRSRPAVRAPGGRPSR